MRKRNTISGLLVHPFLDLGLIPGRTVEREFDAEHQRQHHNENSCDDEQQDLADLTQAHLHQYDVVLVDGVERFGLQTYGLSGDQFKLAEGR